jgi:hypothetical protein
MARLRDWARTRLMVAHKMLRRESGNLTSGTDDALASFREEHDALEDRISVQMARFRESALTIGIAPRKVSHDHRT